MPDWGERLRSRLGKGTGRTSEPEMYQHLRALALQVDPSQIELPEGEPWSGALVAMMEIGLRDGTVTVLAVADGSVSMYFSTGAAVIGAGEHAAVRGAAGRFRTLASEARGLLERTDDEFPLPELGQVRFQVRTVDGTYSGAVPEAGLRTGRHPLAPLYGAGQDLITEVRLITPE